VGKGSFPRGGLKGRGGKEEFLDGEGYWLAKGKFDPKGVGDFREEGIMTVRLSRGGSWERETGGRVVKWGRVGEGEGGRKKVG